MGKRLGGWMNSVRGVKGEERGETSGRCEACVEI